MSLSSFIILPVIYFSKSFEITEERLFYLRVGFFAVQALLFGIIYLLKNKIDAMPNDDELIKVEDKKKSFLDTSPPTYSKMTKREYDNSLLKELFNSSGMTLLLLLGIHIYYKVTTPLLTQLVLIPLKLWENKLVHLHLLKKPIERPFPVEKNPLQSFLQSNSAPEKKEKKVKAITKSPLKPITTSKKNN
eukprot:TRINITY_DN1821_c0_g1_i3.p1 TRINITY_DN1821_c0_g1~~TRINITY_DN1821_c0_g1_i3.p1  ORF type:complete len:190 (-),score=50.23 TRINITY_DN1821_c0_g1_i3:61-630(-)